MSATLLTKALIAVIVLVLIVLFTGRRILRFKTLLALFFIFFFTDNLLIILPNRYPALQIIPNRIWEGFLVCSWSGKLYSILFTLILLYFTRRVISWQEIGLTFRQNPGSILPSVLVILALGTWAARVGFNSPKGYFDPQILLYLAVMPGLNEELVYRGCLLGILNKILPARINLLGAMVGWGVVISSVLFALLHGFGFDNTLTFHYDLIALSNSFVSGLIFAWLRERTGSLVLPMIAHGMEDFLYFLPRMV